MRILTRTNHDGTPHQAEACDKHAALIAERWKMAGFKNVTVQKHDGATRCIMCPEMVGT